MPLGWVLVNVSGLASDKCCPPTGLASDNLFFEDAVTESIGPSVWQDYMEASSPDCRRSRAACEGTAPVCL